MADLELKPNILTSESVFLRSTSRTTVTCGTPPADLEESNVVLWNQQWEDGPYNLSEQGSSGRRGPCPILQTSKTALR